MNMVLHNFSCNCLTCLEHELLALPGHPSSPAVLVVFVLLNLELYVLCFVDRCLSFCPSSFGHCVVCSEGTVIKYEYSFDALINIWEYCLLRNEHGC